MDANSIKDWQQDELNIWGLTRDFSDGGFWQYYPTATIHNLQWDDSGFGQCEIHGRLWWDGFMLEAKNNMSIAVIRQLLGRRDVFIEENVVLKLRLCSVMLFMSKLGCASRDEFEDVQLKLLINGCIVEWVIP